MPRSGHGPVMHSPSTKTSPLWYGSKPAITRLSVDLPQPEGPITQINSLYEFLNPAYLKRCVQFDHV